MGNTHDIALRLEYEMRTIHKKSKRILGTKFDADYIEHSYFFEGMIEILKHYNIEYKEFYDKYSSVKQQSMKKIVNYEEIYDEYIKLKNSIL